MAEETAPAAAAPPEQQDRDAAAQAALKIVNAPAEKKPTVPELLRTYRELFHEKGMDPLWTALDDASGNEASKPVEEPKPNGEKAAAAPAAAKHSSKGLQV